MHGYLLCIVISLINMLIMCAMPQFDPVWWMYIVAPVVYVPIVYIIIVRLDVMLFGPG